MRQNVQRPEMQHLRPSIEGAHVTWTRARKCHRHGMDTHGASQPAHAARGVSLIECMVAMAIVAIAASMVTMSVQGGLAMQEDALRMTVASTAAESRISELLGKPWDDLQALNETESAGTMADDDGISFPAAYRGLVRRTVVTQRALTVPDFPGLAIPGWDIEVTVTDDGGTGAGTGAGERTLVRLRRFRPQTIEDRLQ